MARGNSARPIARSRDSIRSGIRWRTRADGRDAKGASRFWRLPPRSGFFQPIARHPALEQLGRIGRIASPASGRAICRVVAITYGDPPGGEGGGGTGPCWTNPLGTIGTRDPRCQTPKAQTRSRDEFIPVKSRWRVGLMVPHFPFTASATSPLGRFGTAFRFAIMFFLYASTPGWP